jgi:hypothetical protein
LSAIDMGLFTYTSSSTVVQGVRLHHHL